MLFKKGLWVNQPVNVKLEVKIDYEVEARLVSLGFNVIMEADSWFENQENFQTAQSFNLKDRNV